MSTSLTRREFSTLVGLGLAWPAIGLAASAYPSSGFRIRAITAGVRIQSVSDPAPMGEAVAFLQKARDAYVAQGYEVQTLRLATQPLAQYLPDWNSPAALDALAALDRMAVDNDVVLSVGPVLTGDEHVEGFAEWALALIRATQNISFTCAVTPLNGAASEPVEAAPRHGSTTGRGGDTRSGHLQALLSKRGKAVPANEACAAPTIPIGSINEQAVRAAAGAIHAIAAGTSGGEGNFRFAATAHIPPGTPFFPAAWFDSGQAFSIGLESPNLLTHAFREAPGLAQGKARLAQALAAAMAPIAAAGQEVARANRWQYLGIDASPAPGLDASIGEAIEALTGAPFGSPATLAGCAAITDVLKSLPGKTCGYSGLMLPVLEDPVLSQRAAEGRYGVSELLLYSSVCGTGLDVVPLPGDTSVDDLAATITDVAALSAKYRKPLSARLFPAPGKHAGETVSFDNPHLTEAVVMPL